jgi:hypothetical protein
MIIQFIIIFVILILLWLYLLQINKKNLDSIFEEAGFVNSDYKDQDIENILSSCQVPNLNTEQCYKSKFFECPIVNGSYLQCTNNYIPKPDTYNADCSNRTFEMVPYPWKISENCYYNKINFDRNKKYDKVKFI